MAVAPSVLRMNVFQTNCERAFSAISILMPTSIPSTSWLAQPVSGTRRSSIGSELGFWVLPELRLAAGYNLTGTREAGNDSSSGNRRGFYFTVSSKLSRLFDLFGTSKSGLDKSSAPNEQEGGSHR